MHSANAKIDYTAARPYKPRPVKVQGDQSNCCPSLNYELFNRNNINIRYWSWNYRGCWHQTCPPIDNRQSIYIVLNHNLFGETQSETTLTNVYVSSLPPTSKIGQIARLLPPLDVVAVSQAPSPE
jgi:hypothetical protein